MPRRQPLRNIPQLPLADTVEGLKLRIQHQEELLKRIEAQNSALIQLINVQNKTIDSLIASVETTIGERLERLRRAIAQAMGQLAGGSDIPAVDEMKAWVLGKNKPGATQ